MICLGVLGPVETEPLAANGRRDIGGYGSPASCTARFVTTGFGADARADWPLAVAGRTGGAAAAGRADAANGALAAPFVGGRGTPLGALSALAATGRGFGAITAFGLGVGAALTCELGVCGDFARCAGVNAGGACFPPAGAGGGAFEPPALSAGGTRRGTAVLPLLLGGEGGSDSVTAAYPLLDSA